MNAVEPGEMEPSQTLPAVERFFLQHGILRDCLLISSTKGVTMQAVRFMAPTCLRGTHDMTGSFELPRCIKHAFGGFHQDHGRLHHFEVGGLTR